MKTDYLLYPYQSKRMTVHAKNGMVATTQPLAAQAGLRILQQGGNAIDAAIATAAALTVVEPNSNSIGGDSFALVWAEGKLHGLNGSGPAPAALSIEKVKAMGHENMPSQGVLPITVPGTPASWAVLSERFGKLSLLEVLTPAIEYAEQGFPVSPEIGRFWELRYKEYKEPLKGEEFSEWFRVYAPEGRAPRIGELWKSDDHANTLKEIGETNASSFYNGNLAKKIVSCMKEFKGFLNEGDLKRYQPEWVEPIHANYRGYDVWQIPPNGQGLVALLALNILKGYDFTAHDAVDSFHKQIEAVKLAYIDGLDYITDPQYMKISEKALLAQAYAEERRKLIGENAIMPTSGEPIHGETVYLATADGEGNMVSFIQSHAGDFGSAVVVPGTGICLQNRGTGFSLDASHHNALAGGKKTFHTIIPGFLTKGNHPVGPFGVMCGMIQPQAHVQVVMNMIDYHLNPQAALDAPRWRWIKENRIEVEPQFPDHIAQALSRRGHVVERAVDSSMFGRGQIIIRDEEGRLAGVQSQGRWSIAVW